MKEVGCEEQIPKLAEHKIEPAIFWGLGDGDLKELVEVKLWGNRKKLAMRMQSIVKEHEKEMDKKHEDEQKIDKDAVRRLL